MTKWFGVERRLTSEEIKEWCALYEKHPSAEWQKYRERIEALEYSVPGIVRHSLQAINYHEKNDGLSNENAHRDPSAPQAQAGFILSFLNALVFIFRRGGR